MFALRPTLAFILVFTLGLGPILSGKGTPPPLGILTLAHDAYLNETTAFPGLSVFEGEEVSTGLDGRISVRVGLTTVSLVRSSVATLHGMERGAHVDLDAGTVAFLSPGNGIVEIHAEQAYLRPAKNQMTQADVTIMRPGVLQVRVRRGELAFRYREEFQMLPEGETYRIFLDSRAEPPGASTAGTGKPNRLRKVSYFVVATTGAGLTAWGIYEFGHSGRDIESPAKP